MESKFPIRRMFRITLSGLLLFVTLVGIGLGIYVRLTREARQQRAVVHLAWKHNGHIYFDHHIKAGQRTWPPPKNPPPANKIRRWILTDDYFRRVEVIDLSGSDVSDPELLTLQKLTSPFTLFLVECPKVTDEGIGGLKSQAQLTRAGNWGS